MKKLLLKTMLLLCALIVGGASSVWADEVSVSISTYATANSWVNSTSYSSITINSDVTATGLTNGNNSKYYSSNNSWRHYEGDSGTITIATSSGTLNSVTFTYTQGNNGVIKDGTTTIESGTEYDVKGNTSVTFSVSRSSGSKNGNVQITAITVDYTPAGSALTPCVTSLDLTTKSFAKDATGTLTATAIEDAGLTGDVTYTFESADNEVLTVSSDGTYEAAAIGTTKVTVTATPAAGDASSYEAVEAEVDVKVTGTTTMSISAGSGTQTYGTPITFTVSGLATGYDGTVTVSSGTTAVATASISSGTVTVTPVAVGTAVITVTAPATDLYLGSVERTFTAEFTQPAGGTTAAPAATNIFVERFSKASGTGPSGDSWSGSIANDDFASDNDGWTATNNSYSGDGCARFGTSGKTGNATTPAISFDPSVTYTLTFKAGAWNGDGTTLTLSCDDDKAVLGKTSFTMKNNDWTEYETTVKAASGSKLTFTTSSKRFFLDDVVVTSGISITATLNANGYATFCSEYPLDFTSASGYSAWQITGIDGENITFSKITGSVKGGTGLFLMGTANATVTLTSANSSNELTSNLLIGTTAPTYVATGTAYGLKANEFVKNNDAGNIPAGRAYLPASVVDALGVKSFTFVFEDADGVREIRKVSREVVDQIFDLSGRRQQKMQRGINIVNGKKVVIK